MGPDTATDSDTMDWRAKGKPIDLTIHAEARMAKRGIKPELLQKTIDEPDNHWTTTHRAPNVMTRHIAERFFEGRFLRVIYEEDEIEITIVTTIWRDIGSNPEVH